MCPMCFATTALIVAGATSTGGLRVLVMKKLRARTRAKSINPTTGTKGNQDGSSKSRITK